jgi:hypothetical protein
MAKKYEHTGITKSKEGDNAHCIPCNCDIIVKNMGKSAIDRHLNTDKHLYAFAQNWPHLAPQAKKIPKDKTVYYHTYPFKTEPVNFKATVQKCKKLININKKI